jgi:hypothetical protein
MQSAGYLCPVCQYPEPLRTARLMRIVAYEARAADGLPIFTGRRP